MPEILEIEYYRRAALATLGREIATVSMPDANYVRGVTTRQLRSALKGARFTEARRRGKLLMLDTSRGPVFGLRFGMTGRIIVDDDAPIEALEYGPSRPNPDWDRFRLTFADGGSLVISDPRRLGSVTLDPDESALGPDAWTSTVDDLRVALGSSTQAIKARLMNQDRWAGLGNLLTDETLWRAGVDPHTAARELDGDRVAELHATMISVLDELSGRGGSHTGDLQEERRPEGRCPLDGEPLRRDAIGGRTTWWCPHHQR